MFEMLRWIPSGIPCLGRRPPNQIFCFTQLAKGAVSGASGKPTAGHRAAQTAAEHFGHPNVLVAHLREGIEAIHLYTGRRASFYVASFPIAGAV